MRDGQALDFEISVVEMPEKKVPAADEAVTANLDVENSARPAENFPELGMKMYFDDVNFEFTVVEVEPDSDAAAKGIRAGDKFKTVNSQKVFGVEDLRIKLKEAAPLGKATFLFVNDTTVDTITLNLR